METVVSPRNLYKREKETEIGKFCSDSIKYILEVLNKYRMVDSNCILSGSGFLHVRLQNYFIIDVLSADPTGFRSVVYSDFFRLP